MIFSLGMWIYVHTFPDGYRPPPRAEIDAGAVVRVEKAKDGDAERITKVLVERGTVRTTNVAIRESGGERTIPARVGDGDKATDVGILAPDFVVAGTDRKDRFGVEGVPVVLSPGVRVDAKEESQSFNPAKFNEDHVQYIARSKSAKPMAVNVYSAFWTLVVCVAVLVTATPFTKPKPDEELRDLVMGLTAVPDEGPCPWYKHPYLWATIVGAALVTINVIFW
jgi:hypothetical protein